MNTIDRKNRNFEDTHAHISFAFVFMVLPSLHSFSTLVEANGSKHNISLVGLHLYFLECVFQIGVTHVICIIAVS